MPELPEVETVKNGLSPKILGKRIVDAHIFRYDLRRKAPKNSASLLKGQKVIELERRSKYLYIHLSNHYTLVIHLGMSGSLTFQPLHTAPRKHDHLVLIFDDIQIHFNDPRRFGFFDVQPSNELGNLPYIKNLGIEPLGQALTLEYLTKVTKNRSKPIKNLLMDNTIIVGIGNIYACEILFACGILPSKPAQKLTQNQLKKLEKQIKSTLKEAIKSGGSSLKDHKQANGTLGYFQHNFKVYGKKGEHCPTCGTLIVREIQNGRGTFFCPKCQK